MVNKYTREHWGWFREKLGLSCTWPKVCSMCLNDVSKYIAAAANRDDGKWEDYPVVIWCGHVDHNYNNPCDKPTARAVTKTELRPKISSVKPPETMTDAEKYAQAYKYAMKKFFAPSPTYTTFTGDDPYSF